ncbi:unnamed protein product [Pleuronectes platessa]|uniref:Uncharacterized protein n=1 Tax=Pleuronectes platessa TaxID=8262 RepID=A0A9N7VVU0_PLEPL|nr:unnamed protein product [Pleuronectes platessa]
MPPNSNEWVVALFCSASLRKSVYSPSTLKVASEPPVAQRLRKQYIHKRAGQSKVSDNDKNGDGGGGCDTIQVWSILRTTYVRGLQPATFHSDVPKVTSRTGFEPVRGNPIGFRVQRLNLSATVTAYTYSSFKMI